MSSKKNIIYVPCLRGRMGDWIYYVGLLSFNEVAKRVKLPKEIDRKFLDENLKLGDWIQREIDDDRIERIVRYLRKQEQRFFNSIILGIYGGNPSWQEIELNQEANEEKKILTEKTFDYLSKSLGILTLDGTESIFAIDGQHRAVGIREAVKGDNKFTEDEIPVIFVAHKTSEEEKIRTRRLFSTLNKYAKPVSQSEIIALSEDNNCAVITRNLIDSFDLLKNRIIINKNRSINIDNTISFTNILTFYDIIEKILTNKKVFNHKVSGEDHNKYTTERESDGKLKNDQEHVKKILTEVLKSIPSFISYIESNNVDRKQLKTSLIFRPIGQNILFDVIKLSKEHSKFKQAKEYFAKDTFNLTNHVWKTIFWDEESNNIRTEKTRQKFATLLILNHLGINIKKTRKDIEMFESFNIDPSKL